MTEEKVTELYWDGPDLIIETEAGLVWQYTDAKILDSTFSYQPESLKEYLIKVHELQDLHKLPPPSPNFSF